MVIKVDQVALQKELGATLHAPSWALAYKWGGEQAATTVEAIELQVSRSGKVTPVALLHPVVLSGATIRRSALHNFDFLLKHRLLPGAPVLVERVGATVPSIRPCEGAEQPVSSHEIRQHVRALRCPCPQQSELAVSGKEVRCANALKGCCQEQRIAQLAHFAAKDAMNLPGLGADTVRALVEGGHAGSLGELIGLAASRPAEVAGIGAGVRLKKILAGIEGLQGIRALPAEQRRESLKRCLIGFGIPQLGKGGASALVDAYPDPNKLLDAVLAADSALVEILGEATAASVVDSFSQKNEYPSIIRSLFD